MSDLPNYGGQADETEKIAELERLISEYTPLVFSLAKKYSTSADYEELVSDGMQALLSAATHYNSEKGGFGSFAAVCIANCMKNTVSNAKRRASKLADEEELVSVADSAPSPEEVVIRRETSEELYKLVLSELTPLEKACLDGVIFGLSYEEIAGKIGAEKKTVDNAVTRARAKLRKYHSYFTE